MSGWARPPGRRCDESPVVLAQTSVRLIPDGAWWTATFRADPAQTEIYCDIGTPPRWPHSAEVTMVDLDLDVILLRAEQRILLDDE